MLPEKASSSPGETYREPFLFPQKFSSDRFLGMVTSTAVMNGAALGTVFEVRKFVTANIEVHTPSEA
jgi:hypothetical protein